ncbi:hypothetical protein GUITHDRAFT_110555 [Guillardia theta CCMP2712]|uniref:Uncharacterized protein n=1 Tax=Guillardia theta (strain CCMP2712) TaxID=905079 RepID=L1J4H9_GUITC|nr:hypothetical protein GUITHDRAFT_110555 [Guillardia theta CCMP2712]EKX43433.1 hypothetical protein GUITHDRAFT_110555 [Guillardia theta CCMP2712]|eukprot:XP_005830413.1 hypothetical protein GUITHDRAFT_110555 [Guillardia theta CCMP2712]
MAAASSPWLHALGLRGGGIDGILTDDNDYAFFKQKFKKKDQKARKAIERKGGRDVRVFRDEDYVKKKAKASPDLKRLESMQEQRRAFFLKQLQVTSSDDLHKLLWEAVELGQDLLVRQSVQAGADVNTRYSTIPGDWAGFDMTNINATVLHVAARNNYSSIVEFLIEKGADINAQTRFGMTPLMTAAHRGSTNAAIALVQAGADLWVKDTRMEAKVSRSRSGYIAAQIAEIFAADWRIALWLREVCEWDQEGRAAAMPRPLGEEPDEGGHEEEEVEEE